MSARGSAWKCDWFAFVVVLAVLLGAFAALGIGFEGDTFTCMKWGRQVTSGLPIDRVNPVLTAPKILLIALGAVGQAVPGERGAELFVAFMAAAAGAGVVVLTSRLARRLGGVVAGVVAVPLVLGHMQFIRFTVSGQSPIFASVFALGALVLATREEARVRDHLWAAVLVFGASMARPETSALAGAVGLALYLRLGWKRPWWPALLVASGAVGAAANLVVCKLAFGSFGYAYELQLLDSAWVGHEMPGLTVGFAKKMVRMMLYYVNGSWLLMLLSALGLGLLARPGWRRYTPLVLFPLATTAFTWLLQARGVYFNERCFYYATFVVVALASAAIARLASWAASSDEFLSVLPRRWREAAFALAVLAAVAPHYATRPVPREFGRDYRALEHVCGLLREELATAGDPAPLVFDETAHVAYRLRLPTDPCFRGVVRAFRTLEGDLPDAVAFYVSDVFPPDTTFPARWRLREVWRAPEGNVALWRRAPIGEPVPTRGGGTTTRPWSQ